MVKVELVVKEDAVALALVEASSAATGVKMEKGLERISVFL